MNFIYNFLLALIVFSPICRGNEDSSSFTFSGYAEWYYSYDFSQSRTKPDFIYNHKRLDEININLIVGSVNYRNKNVRANIGLMAGNYAQYNLSKEPAFAQFLYEANGGIRLDSSHNIWFDMGVFPSHIGFESAVGADCYTVTRSIVAENSPYYEAGAKISYKTTDSTLLLSLLYLNGWQTIFRNPDIHTPSFGLQLQYRFSPFFLINYSNFIGSDRQDNEQSMRVYQNVYSHVFFSKNFGVIAGFDIGRDRGEGRRYYYWYTPTIIAHGRFSEQWSIACRYEYFRDKNAALFSSEFDCTGYSANLDYMLSSQTLLRIEGRHLTSSYKIFDKNVRNNTALTFSMSMRM